MNSIFMCYHLHTFGYADAKRHLKNLLFCAVLYCVSLSISCINVNVGVQNNVLLSSVDLAMMEKVKTLM